jgi:hypothetical protein
MSLPLYSTASHAIERRARHQGKQAATVGGRMKEAWNCSNQNELSNRENRRVRREGVWEWTRGVID